MKPIGWEAGKKYPMILTHPRRPGRDVRLRLVSRVPGLRVARLGGLLHQPARLDRLRREVRARHRAELGRQRLRRRHERRRRGAREVSVDRHGSPRRHRRQLRRLPDQLDRQPHQPLQGGGHASQHLQLHQRRRHARRRVRARGRFRRRHLREARSLLERVAAQVREERQDADAGPPLRQRLPRADRAGRAVVPRAAALRRAEPRSSSSRARTTTSRAPASRSTWSRA